MVDTEFNELKKRVIISIVVIIIFVIPLFIFVFKTYGYKESEVLDRINNKENMVLLLRNSSCDYCSEITDLLDDYGVSYEEVMINTDERYKDIVNALDIPENDIVVPELVEVKKGEGVSYVVNIKDEEAVLEFISYLDNKVLDSR